MAGLIIVRGAIDEVPEIAAAREVVVALTDLCLFPGEDGVWSYLPEQNAIWDLFTSKVWRGGPQQGEEAPELLCGFSPGGCPLHLYLHNGAPFYAEQHDDAAPTRPCGTQLEVPTWQIQPGEVLRLRLLNGCSDLLMPLHLEGHPMHLIALDGVNFSRPRAIQTEDQQPWDGVVTYADDARALVLAPGNRAELLIQGGEEGIYELVQLGHEGQQMITGARKVLARLIVQGSPLDMTLPTSLPLPSRHQALIEREGPFSAEREVVFEVMAPATHNRTLGVDFLINGALYEEESVAVRVKRGSHERWTLSAPPMSNGTAEGHPFHIHVNPFELDSINGLIQPEGTVMDTVWVSGHGQVVLRTHFQDWSGKTVYHCHILPHEDTGMMQNLLIEP
jgi:suppressor of ftsI